MSLRLLLTLSGGIEILTGVLTLISPATSVSLLLGGPTDAIAAVLARLFGAGVFALGLACLKARDDVGSAAGLAVSIGITSSRNWASKTTPSSCIPPTMAPSRLAGPMAARRLSVARKRPTEKAASACRVPSAGP